MRTLRALFDGLKARCFRPRDGIGHDAAAGAVPGAEWMLPPPAPDADLRTWQDWKQQILTGSQDAFVRRNPWFTFRKEDIHQHLGATVAVARPLYRTATDGARPFSEVVARLDLAAAAGRVALKGSLGHSGQEVRILDMAEWPRRARCLLHKRWFTPGELDAWVADRPYMVEEAFGDAAEPVTRDFKVYVLRGEPRIVAMFDRNEARPVLTMIDARSWLRIPGSEIFAGAFPAQWTEGGCLEDAAARRAQRAASFARAVVRATDAEDLFIGIDTYVPLERPGEVLLGEITPRMGALHAPWLRVRFLEHLFLSPTGPG